MPKTSTVKKQHFLVANSSNSNTAIIRITKVGETLQMQKPRYVRTGNILIFHRKQADQEKVKAVAFVTFF